jgi:hypothetical protein
VDCCDDGFGHLESFFCFGKICCSWRSFGELWLSLPSKTKWRTHRHRMVVVGCWGAMVVIRVIVLVRVLLMHCDSTGHDRLEGLEKLRHVYWACQGL